MIVWLLSRLSDNEFTNKNIDFHIDVDFTRDKTLNAGKELVSFDVVSFFTKKPSCSCRRGCGGET